MKNLFFIFLLASLSATAQRVNLVPDHDQKVSLNLTRYDQQIKEGKAFMLAGAAITTVSTLFFLTDMKDRQEFASAVSLIGGAFTIYGFTALIDSDRHKRKAHFGQGTASR